MDPLWLCDQHSLLQRPSTLLAANDEEADEIDKKLKEVKAGGEGADLMAAFGAATQEREEKLRKRLEQMSKRKARELDAMDFFLKMHRMDLAEYEPMAHWELEVMTPNQREFLIKNGFDIDTVKGRGHASKIIEAIIDRTRSNFCTVKQATYAQSLGHPDPWNRSFEDVSQFISDAKAGKDCFAHVPDF